VLCCHTDYLGTLRIEYRFVLYAFADGNTARQYWIEPLCHAPGAEPAFPWAVLR
jgi:hypothetical protein